MAATSYGEIRGQVKDATGGVLPGVSVEVKGPSLQGTKTATTAGDGTYRIALVPPGDYTVSFALAGFGKVEKKAAVQLDKTVVVEAAMSLATTAAVTVTGAAPVIDATSSGSGMNFTSDVLKGLPLGRGFTSVATKAPGVIQGYGVDSGNINVQGSTGAENNFIIDGVDVTEIQYGRQGKSAPGEFIQEIEVKSGGFQAEYGHSQGGVLNAITKSGGNAFHGDAFGYYTGRPQTAEDGNFWQAKEAHLQSKADSRGTNRSQTDNIRNTLRADYGADLGGYAWKDRVWFFGAYDRVHTGGENFLNNPVGHCTTPCDAGPGTGTVGTESTATDVVQHLYAGKLTFRVTEGLSLVASVFGDPVSTGPNLATPLAGAGPGTYKGTLKQGGIDYTGRLSGVVGSNFLFEAQAARHNESTVQSPLNTVDRRFITVLPSGVPAQGGYGFYRTQNFKRDFYRGSASYYANFVGTHEFKIGGDYTINNSDSKRVYTGPAGNKATVFVRTFKEGTFYQHEYNSSGVRNAAGDPIEVDIAPGGTISKSNNSVAFFQDKGQVLPNLTLNLGLRWEGQT
ncbi:MAG: carboxypeptidase regulatory-like domain-containing protein, partial [Thermoanaerobaculia bacterium]